MKEIKQIIKAFEVAQRQGLQTALATIVHVDGSAYRRPGARMLITEKGELTGAISGGCLEGDVLRKALYVLQQKQAMLITYDTMDDDEAKFGVGLGCNGIIQVLIEPIDASNGMNVISLLRDAVEGRQKAVIVAVFNLQDKKDKQQGTILLVKNDAPVFAGANDFSLREILVADAKEAMIKGKTSFKNYQTNERSFTAFIEFIPRPISLVIVGAGNDVIPMAAMADILGWEVTIIDGRANYAKPERFTSSCQILVAKPEQVLEKLFIDEQTAFVLMTHNYNYDYALLKKLAQKNVSYIGSLGPKKKFVRMMNELKEEGIVFSDNQLAAIYGPGGLDIGADTPEEIALSILAEIKAVLSGTKGQSLRMNEEVIHKREDTRIEHVKVG